MAFRKIEAGLVQSSVGNFIGKKGTIFYDNDNGVLRLSNGVTPGGVIINSAVAITGGSINNTPIGATTPVAGTFTTITGQTEVLKGTGQNLFTNSSTFTSWGANNGTLTLSAATTDPFSGTSVYKLVANNGFDPSTGSSAILSNGATVLPIGVSVTQSIYFKAAEFNALRIRNNSSGEIYTFTIGVTPTATSGVLTPALTLISNGWYRASWSFSTGQIATSGRSDNWSFRVASTGDGTSGIYVSSPQLEYGSTLGTYISTTTTAVYGTPTLSFSGVAGLGLQSDGSLYVSPAGVGALQAQATTSTAVGGNARGTNAVDWQTSRGTAAQVASGSYSVISGGYNNTNSGAYCVVGGGYNNSVSGGGGFIGGGNSNTIGSNRGVVVGGQNNNASGLFGIVVGGASNLATSSTAVTTSVMTIAVTASATLYLTATNANVKIGQYIVGPTQDTYATSTVTTGTTALNTAFTSTGSVIAVTTGILTIGTLTAGTIVAGQVLSGTGVPAGTYVVSNIAGGSASGSTWNTNIITAVASTAINGTAYTITISQNTTTAAGTTITFYTPHGVVVGGGNNQATGSFSFIGAGGDAGTAANRNTASGAWSTVVGGIKNTASGAGSFIGGGGLYDAQLTPAANLASGTSSVIVGGSGNTATSSYGMILGGRGNYVDALMGAVIGGAFGSTRGITGNTVFPGNYAALGNYSVTAVQAALLVIAKQTTDATPTVLTSDGGSGVSSNQVYLQSNSAYYFVGSVIAGVTGGGNTKGWTFEGAIKKGAANSIAFVGSPTVTSSFADAGASAWSIALTANTTTDTLTVTVTGQAATTIRWVCKIETTEMNF